MLAQSSQEARRRPPSQQQHLQQQLLPLAALPLAPAVNSVAGAERRRSTRLQRAGAAAIAAAPAPRRGNECGDNAQAAQSALIGATTVDSAHSTAAANAIVEVHVHSCSTGTAEAVRAAATAAVSDNDESNGRDDVDCDVQVHSSVSAASRASTLTAPATHSGAPTSSKSVLSSIHPFGSPAGALAGTLADAFAAAAAPAVSIRFVGNPFMETYHQDIYDYHRASEVRTVWRGKCALSVSIGNSRKPTPSA